MPRISAYLAIGFSVVPQAFGAVDLLSAFEHAQQKTETLSLQRSVVDRADYAMDRVEGMIYPQFNVLGAYQVQQQTQGIGGFGIPEQYNVRLNVTQPLFQGFREFKEHRAAKLSHQAETQRMSSTRALLFADTARSFYSVLSLEKDRANLKSLLDLTEQRAADLNRRMKIGQTRRGDWLSARTQVASLQAQLESSELDLSRARENLELTTGLPRNSELSESLISPKTATPLEGFLANLEKRPDIEAQKLALDAAEARKSSAWGAHLPTLDFSGNYYFARSGALAATKWDVGVQFAIPIFSGGAINAAVREAEEVRRGEELRLHRTRRTAESEIRASYEGWRRALNQNEAVSEALRLAEENYNEQNRDYKNGLISNLEVITAMNSLTELRRVFDRNRFKTQTAWAELQAASNQIP